MCIFYIYYMHMYMCTYVYMYVCVHMYIDMCHIHTYVDVKNFLSRCVHLAADAYIYRTLWHPRERVLFLFTTSTVRDRRFTAGLLNHRYLPLAWCAIPGNKPRAGFSRGRTQVLGTAGFGARGSQHTGACLHKR